MLICSAQVQPRMESGSTTLYPVNIDIPFKRGFPGSLRAFLFTVFIKAGITMEQIFHFSAVAIAQPQLGARIVSGPDDQRRILALENAWNQAERQKDSVAL
ncbi:MAG TPA: hypothetical protein VFF50_08985, partial [Candidatus Deferrimicrobiaceae bacterium]|nr:hypothetical protein [Candidatus Deferrimicrobiaceae bacterium]